MFHACSFGPLGHEEMLARLSNFQRWRRLSRTSLAAASAKRAFGLYTVKAPPLLAGGSLITLTRPAVEKQGLTDRRLDRFRLEGLGDQKRRFGLLAGKQTLGKCSDEDDGQRGLLQDAVDRL